MLPGEVFGPVLDVVTSTPNNAIYVSVAVPIVTFGRRWVNIWFDDTNQPALGIRQAVVLRTSIPEVLINTLCQHYGSDRGATPTEVLAAPVQQTMGDAPLPRGMYLAAYGEWPQSAATPTASTPVVPSASDQDANIGQLTELMGATAVDDRAPITRTPIRTRLDILDPAAKLVLKSE